MKRLLHTTFALGLVVALAHAGYAKSPATLTKTGTGTATAGVSKSKPKAGKTARTHHNKSLPGRPGIHRRHASILPSAGPIFTGMLRPAYYVMNPFTYWPDRNGPVAIYSGGGSGGHHYAYHHYRGRHHHSGHHHHRRV